MGVNDRIRVAVAGLNGRGRAHVAAYASMPDVEVAYLVDPDERTVDSQLRVVERLTGTRPKVVRDVRVALDDRAVDALSIAAPNHWHALMTIWACEAGKDVLVEKIFSHNVREGRIAVEVARRRGRIVQHGAQRRGMGRYAGAIDFIRSGKAGRVRRARALCYRPRESMGYQVNSLSPEAVDFNLWLGPARAQPYHDNLLHYNWHFFWDLGDGELGAQAVHQLDVARWGLGDPGHPRYIRALGGRYGYRDQAETPNTLVAQYQYDEVELILEIRGLRTDGYFGWVPSHLNNAKMVGNIFECEKGSVVDDLFFPNGVARPIAIAPLHQDGTDLHNRCLFHNFISTMRSRRCEDLLSSIEQGHHSATLCHLANISYRLGNDASLASGNTEFFPEGSAAAISWQATIEHLADNNVAFEKSRCTAGRALKFDPSTEQFVDDRDANSLLFGTYRDPFVVRELS